MGEPHRLLERVKILALQVLDDREFEARAIVGGPDQGRNRLQVRGRRSPPAPLPGDQFVAPLSAGYGPHDDRHEDAQFADRPGQFGQGRRVEVPAWLLRVRAHGVHPDLLETPLGRALLAQQGAEPAAQTTLGAHVPATSRAKARYACAPRLLTSKSATGFP